LPDARLSLNNLTKPPEVVAERIMRYTTVLGRENVIAGVDCGFGTSAQTEQEDAEVAWAKLRALVEGAELATRALWGT
jgi:5-methyltetrahydropteroyltriglutamate--homocysteine methyltransferase